MTTGSRSTFNVAVIALGLAAMAWTIWFFIYTDLFRPDLYQTSDFLTSFYTAGYATLQRLYPALYPAPGTQTYAGSAFDTLSHHLLPLLPRESVTNWQYCPASALFFSGFAWLPPQPALICWHLLNFAALFASCWLLSRWRRFPHPGWLFVTSFTFAPCFEMIKVGQLGLVLGVLPACLGLYLLGRGRSFAAGLAFSISLLSIKYLPSLFFISVLLSFVQNRRTLYGLAAGSASMVAATLACLPPSLWAAWLASASLAQKYYLYDTSISQRLYLHVSLPAQLIAVLPAEAKQGGTYIVYGLAAAVALHALFLGIKIAGSALSQDAKLALWTIIAFFLMPIVSIHLLFYDLAGLLISTLLLWQSPWPEAQPSRFKALAATLWIVLAVYFVFFAFASPAIFSPLVLSLILAGVYIQLNCACNSLVTGDSKIGS